MKKIFFAIAFIVPFGELLAQQKYEPGGILLQVRAPEVVRFGNGRVINGSPQLQAVFQQYPATDSRKLSHVNPPAVGQVPKPMAVIESNFFTPHRFCEILKRRGTLLFCKQVFTVAACFGNMLMQCDTNL